MGWFTKFIKFITPPPPKVDEVKKAKVIKEAMKEATVTLKPLKEAVTPVTETKPKRVRTEKGTYVADDKSTPDVNEAWVGGNAPAKKKAVKKPKVKVVRVKKKK